MMMVYLFSQDDLNALNYLNDKLNYNLIDDCAFPSLEVLWVAGWAAS